MSYAGKRRRNLFRRVANLLGRLFSPEQSARPTTNAVSPSETITPLPPAILDMAVHNAIVGNSPTRGWWAQQPADFVREFIAVVEAGLERGDSIRSIAKIFKQTDTYRRAIALGVDVDAILLVQTSVMTAANSIQFEAKRRNPDVHRGWQVSAVCDNKTCSTCQELAGAAFDFEGKPLRESKYRGVLPEPFPPFHPGCRCIIMSVVVGDRADATLRWEHMAASIGGTSTSPKRKPRKTVR